MPRQRARAATVVLPLGDSLTVGEASAPVGFVPSGYRSRLARLSFLSGRVWAYGGAQVTNFGDGLFYRAHGGITGDRIDQIQARVATELQCRPTHVLIHAGTNDALQGHLLASAGSRLATLVQTCLDYATQPKVFVCRIMGCDPALTGGTPLSNINTINSQIDGGALATQLASGRCFLVDMNAAVPYNTTNFYPAPGDGVHLTAAGYELEAAAWNTALVTNG